MKLIAFLLLCIITFYLLPSNVQAHVLQYDGTVRAVLHIRPDDDPVAGKESELIFEFKDTEDKFSTDLCDCVFSVMENEKEIFYQKLISNSSKNGTIKYTFPRKGVYQIKVSGNPIQQNDFQPISFIFDVRVDREGTTTQTQLHSSKASMYILISLSIVLIAFVVFVSVKSKKVVPLKRNV